MKELSKNNGRPHTFRIPVIGLDTVTLPLAISLFLILFGNVSFWCALVDILRVHSIKDIGFFVSVFVSLVAFFNAFLSFFSFRHVFRPTLIFILITSSVVSYFMNSYGVMIDRSMMQNVIETDVREVGELLNTRMFFYFVFLGLLPSFFVYRSSVRFMPLAKELPKRLSTVSISLFVIAVSIFLFYGDYMSLGRNHNHLRHLINPINYLYASGSIIQRALCDGIQPLEPIGGDAHLMPDRWNGEKKTITILVIGEAARAENFALNGYARNTNPLLSKENIVFFSNFYSCGTSTAVSVPCIFSIFNRESFSISKGRKYENLLDVLLHAGMNVLWRDNNSGCKGVCERVETESMFDSQVPEFCNTGECHDEILLYGLQDYIDQIDNDAFIVLHQKGSHGPAYYRRYPDQFRVFEPECRTQEIRECEDQAIVNAYDNTILYTDFFLAQVIGFLKRNSDQFNTAMLYVSDHGQSLGENNIYLHGLPYFIAPNEQKHIPFIIWLSDGFAESLGVSKVGLKEISDQPYSHDNLFHTILTITGVETDVYEASLDILSGTGRPNGSIPLSERSIPDAGLEPYLSTPHPTPETTPW